TLRRRDVERTFLEALDNVRLSGEWARAAVLVAVLDLLVVERDVRHLHLRRLVAVDGERLLADVGDAADHRLDHVRLVPDARTGQRDEGRRHALHDDAPDRGGRARERYRRRLWS